MQNTRFGMMDYLDGQITTGRESQERRSVNSVMDIQNQSTLKNRLSQLNQNQLQQRRVMSVARNENNNSPESYRGERNTMVSRHQANGSTSSMETTKKHNTSIAHVNKINKPLQQKLQFNATTLGKRFVHRAMPR